MNPGKLLEQLRAFARTPVGKSALGVIVVLLATVGVTITVVDNGPDHPPGTPRGTVTVELGGPQPGKQTVTVPKPALQQVEANDLGHHEGAKDESPAGLPASQLEARNQQLAKFRALDGLPSHFPASAPQQRGCTTNLVRNYSSRHGVAPRVFVLHYTVSSNRPGWGDVNAVVGLFNNSAAAASSNYVIDNEGHCAYIVREVDKAWTQAAANPFSISAEVINTGREPTYAAGAGLAKLGVVIADSLKRWHIPVQRGLVSGCRVVRPGVVDHHSLGACGGGHFDISPPYSVDAVIAAAKAAGGKPVNRKLAVWQRELRIVRAKAKAHGWKRAYRARGRTLKRLIARELAR